MFTLASLSQFFLLDELYNADEELGIIVGGYGTLGYINGSNFWVFSVIDHTQYVEDSSYYNYYDMKGLDVSTEVISGYPLILLVGIASICSVVVIKKKLNNIFQSFFF